MIKKVSKPNHFYKDHLQYSVLLVGIFLIPLFSGLYFKEAFYPAFICSAAFLFITLFRSNRIVFDARILTIFLFGILINIISVFTGINKEEALYGLFKYSLPLLIFLLILNIISNSEAKNTEKTAEEKINRQFHAIFYSGIAVSVINIIMAQSTSRDSNIKALRLEFVIPYSNTLAVFFLACTLIGINLSKNYEFCGWKNIFINIGAFLNLTCLILTYSRMMWVISIIALALYVFVQREKRLLLNCSFIFIPAVICSMIISALGWNNIILTVLISAIFIFIAHKLLERFHTKAINMFRQMPKYYLIIGAVCILLAFAYFLSKSGSIFSRLLSINLGSTELQERFAYYIDAFKIIKDHPLTGIGTGGWDAIQYQYQSGIYATKYVHSSLLQAALDHGFPGLAILLTQIVLFVFYSVKALKKQNSQIKKDIIIAAIFVNSSILLHSLLDIDFEFPLVNIFFMINIAVLSIISESAGSFPFEKRPFKLASGLICLSIIIFAIPLSISAGYYSQGVRLFNNGAFKEAEVNFRKAVKFNSVSSSAYYMVGQAEMEQYRKSPTEQQYKDCVESFRKAQQYNSKEPKYYAAAGYVSDLARDYSQSAAEYERLMVYQPLVVEHYETYTTTLIKAAQKDHEQGKTNEALEKYRKVAGIEETLMEARQKVSKRAYSLKNKPNLLVTPRLAYNIAEACIFLGDKKAAEPYLKIAESDKNLSILIENLHK